MIDPPREEARDAVARAKRAGIRPIMITGDHPENRRGHRRRTRHRERTGAPSRALSSSRSRRRRSIETVRDVSVYARVNPEHKLRIVRALQRAGHDGRHDRRWRQRRARPEDR